MACESAAEKRERREKRRERRGRVRFAFAS
jgi:hypothetical protein